MWKLVRTYATVDEATRRKTEQDVKEKKTPEEKVRQRGSAKSNVFDRINKGRTEPKVNMGTLTPLTKSRTEILSLHKDVIRPPPQLQVPPHKRDRSKWCEFHHDHGHITELCKDVMKEIEKCLKHGLLREYVAGT